MQVSDSLAVPVTMVPAVVSPDITSNDFMLCKEMFLLARPAFTRTDPSSAFCNMAGALLGMTLPDGICNASGKHSPLWLKTTTSQACMPCGSMISSVSPAFMSSTIMPPALTGCRSVPAISFLAPGITTPDGAGS